MEPRPRIDGAMMKNYIGKFVCLVGKVNKISPNGGSMEISTCDGTNVSVSLREPLTEELQGVVEIVAQVESDRSVVGLNVISFGEDYDLELYNQAVQFMSKCPQAYPNRPRMGAGF